jgi:hypothetical protein
MTRWVGGKAIAARWIWMQYSIAAGLCFASGLAMLSRRGLSDALEPVRHLHHASLTLLLCLAAAIALIALLHELAHCAVYVWAGGETAQVRLSHRFLIIMPHARLDDLVVMQRLGDVALVLLAGVAVNCIIQAVLDTLLATRVDPGLDRFVALLSLANLGMIFLSINPFVHSDLSLLVSFLARRPRLRADSLEFCKRLLRGGNGLSAADLAIAAYYPFAMLSELGVNLAAASAVLALALQ